MKRSLYVIFSAFIALSLLACVSKSQQQVGIDLSNLNESLKGAQPGDTLFINDGEWSDIQLKVKAKGTAESPIVIKAINAGKVVVTGESNLKIGGEYVVIDGLYFKDGVLGDAPVVVFKEGGNVAKYCRLTNCAIDNYNPTNRFMKTDWIALYGQHNQIDHCTFANKYSSGLMLAVKLSGEENLNNYHKIEYNHFVNRPRLGSNGGETARVGTSTYSLEPAHVQFTNNYFEHCAGEVEILSVKSTENVVSGNVFYECEGVLALRHGNKNVVTNNTFIGNNRPNTGGIRVINAGHTIANNHFQDLTGFRFWSAFAMMNGVPNSAINRYHQVKDVVVRDNNFVNCDNIGFGIGTDGERTALPENVTFQDNYIYSEDAQEVHFLDDMSGVDFDNNKVNAKVSVGQAGFVTKKLKVQDLDGVKHIKGAAQVNSVTKAECGSPWFTLSNSDALVSTTVKVGTAAELEEAVKHAKAGDVITLTKAEPYLINAALVLDVKAAIVKAQNLNTNPVIKFAENTGDPILIIAQGGDLTLDGVDFAGLTNGGIAPCAIKTQSEPFLTQYNLRVKNCHFYDFNAGGRTVYSATPTSYADTVLFENCKFSNVSGIAINLKAEKDDIGRYNAENVIVKNCLFYDVMGSAIDLYRGGNDESTSGPKLHIDQCTFHNVENRELGSVILLTGVQAVHISNCVFSESGKSGRVINMESPRWAKCSIDYCNFYHCGRIETFYNTRLGKNIWYDKVDFSSVDTDDYSLSMNSPLLTKSSEGQALGAK